MCKNIQPFILKSGYSINNHTNDTETNSKLKYLYNVANDAWMLKYGTTKFLSHHMDSVLVEAWDALKVSAGNIIRDIIAKTMLPPLRTTNLTTYTHAGSASIQVFSGTKAE